MDINSILHFYSGKAAVSVDKKDTSRGVDDKRYTYIVNFDSETGIVIKVAKNSFTDIDRVIGWQRICEHYNNIGIYCPQIMKNRNGNYAEQIELNNEEFIVYAEEMKRFKFTYVHNHLQALCIVPTLAISYFAHRQL